MAIGWMGMLFTGNFFNLMYMVFLKLIRLPNLLIIALAQYLMRWCIIHPMLKINGFTLQFSEIHFFLLVMSTVSITAAGYVINDYFDTKTDLLNHPETVVVGKRIQRRTAMGLHFLFNLLGVLLGSYISFAIKLPALSVVFVMIAGILWFYSTTYKRQFLIGNLIVASLTALVPLMVILFEMPLLNREYGMVMLKNKADFVYLFGWVSAFSFFAFMTNLIREIIKDIEDFEGDSVYGRNTLPVKLGIRTTKYCVIALILINITSLAFLYVYFFTRIGKENRMDLLTLGYFVFFLVTPQIVLLFKLWKAKNKASYRVAANLAKLIMLAGVLYAVLVNYIVLQNS